MARVDRTRYEKECEIADAAAIKAQEERRASLQIAPDSRMRKRAEVHLSPSARASIANVCIT